MQLLYIRFVAIYGRAGYLDSVVEHGARLLVKPGAPVVLNDPLREDRVSGEAPQLGAVVGESEDALVFGGDHNPDHLPLDAGKPRRSLPDKLIEVEPPEHQLRPPSMGAHDVVRFAELLALSGDQLRDARVEVLLVGDGKPADPFRGCPVGRFATLLFGVHRPADTRS